MQTCTLCTAWGEHIDPQNVLQEYPRPQMVRDSYLNLNGYWEYAITQKSDTPEHYDGKILVPFSPEAALSGVGRQAMPQDYLHYSRSVMITEAFMQERLLLHFGAVDQICTVYWNGIEVGSHVGGYLPFVCDVTDAVHIGENRLTLTVKDYSDTSHHTRGKQRLKNSGMFYQAQSGIWQTVWMESVPENYIRTIRITPLYDESTIEFEIDGADTEPVRISIMDAGKIISEQTFQAGNICRMAIEHVVSWTPEQPHLYDAVITAGKDRIRTYFAMRKYSVDRDCHGILRLFLNNQPYFHHGILDQGYWPEGLYTAPDDAALVYDIQKMKQLGFNMLRKHVKIAPARWYYHCDRLGMLVWQDMVNGGSKYHMNLVCMFPSLFGKLGRRLRDNNYGLLARRERAGREQFCKELTEMLRHLYNCPCIAVWVPFNEAWGQFDAQYVTQMIREFDPTRQIDEASGWFDQGGGDIYSRHNYWYKLKVQLEKHRVFAVTEYGGYSHRIPMHSMVERIYGYRKYATKAQLSARYDRLQREEIIANIPKGLCGGVYTQLSDVEEEVNGLLTYDRRVLKIDANIIQARSSDLYRKFKESTDE